MTDIAATAPRAIRYDAVRDGPIELSADESAVFVKKAEAMAKLLSNKKVVAKYKLEILFGAARSTREATAGALTFWASGSKLHGGGDDKIYLCPGRSLKVNDCQAPLLSDYNAGGQIVCPTCGNLWKSEVCVGELFFKLTMRGWADVIHRYFRLFDCDCDIYLKHARDDIRSIALAQSKRQTWKGSQQLDKARNERARYIYPLHNIVQDTNAGADLLARFYAFLTA